MPYGPWMFDEHVDLLRRFGSRVLPLLIEWQTSSDPISRFHAAYVLGSLGEAAAPAAPFVISAWRNGPHPRTGPNYDPFWEWDEETRKAWMFTDPSDPNALWSALGADAIPFLSAALEDPHARVRRRAASALVSAGGAAACLPRLRTLLNDEDPTVRVAAAKAVLELGGDGDLAAEQARRLLELGDGPPQRRR